VREIRALTVVTVAVAALALAACGGGSDDREADDASGTGEAVTSAGGNDDPDPDADPDTDTADGEDAEPVPAQLTVVATVAPIADLVAVVGGERIEVHSLVPSGADAHTYEPRPQDVVVLDDADAYVGVGLDLNDGALRLARENLPEGAPLVLLGEDLLDEHDLVFDHSHGDDDQGHPHGDDDQGHSHGDDDHGHSHGDDEVGPNPHLWTSLRNAASLVDGIAGTLSDLDPEGADQYAANAIDYRDQLLELDASVSEAVSTIPESNRVLVTYHDAWTYFARDHDLTFATALQPTDFSEPSAGELRALIDQVRDLEVPAVFGSEVFPTPVLEALAEETDARYVGDLSDDVLPGAPGDPEHTYLEMMRRNARSIVDGLGGDVSALD
jgi:ABC-type Zn uptake system ZnuABC Zn-binding protein ZnuA